MQQRLESGGSVSRREYEANKSRIAGLTLQSPGATAAPGQRRMVAWEGACGAGNVVCIAADGSPQRPCLPAVHAVLFHMLCALCRRGPAGGRVSRGGLGPAGAAPAPAAHHHRVPAAVVQQSGAWAQVGWRRGEGGGRGAALAFTRPACLAPPAAPTWCRPSHPLPACCSQEEWGQKEDELLMGLAEKHGQRQACWRKFGCCCCCCMPWLRHAVNAACPPSDRLAASPLACSGTR